MVTVEKKKLSYRFNADTIRPALRLDQVSVLTKLAGLKRKDVDPAIFRRALQLDTVPKGLENIGEQPFERSPI
jgi:hypothetical protein